jgi:hypothetical protein
VPGSGAQGAPGPQGQQGPRGLQGLQGVGAQGVPGPQGHQGPRGLQGAQGTTGSGAQGPTGPQGPRGLNGEQGTPGSASNTGAQGPTGIQGARGLTGSQGPVGSCGSTGPQGSTGPTGPPGENYSGTNYRDLVSFSFTESSGTPGLTVPINSYKPVLIFTQPATASIKYISFTIANTVNTSLQINRIIMYDLTNCTDYMFSSYSTTLPDYEINGAVSLSEPLSTLTISGTDMNKIFEIDTGCGCNFIIPKPVTRSRPIGVVIQITTSSGSCQLFSCNVGFSDV